MHKLMAAGFALTIICQAVSAKAHPLPSGPVFSLEGDFITVHKVPAWSSGRLSALDDSTLTANPGIDERTFRPHAEVSPWVAGLLPVVTGTVLMGSGLLLNNMPLMVTSTFTGGLGHFYAGDHLRGGLVTAGLPVVVLTNAVAMTLAAMPRVEPGGSGYQPDTRFAWLFLMVPLLLYEGLAGWDAFHVAQSRNQPQP